ncbi:MAG: hypothetical protein U5K79_13240 [Cyclobacteriaceae bacterium]|nr:hypothetical protein [Cyclobacteriaceae bacterium]
MEPAIKLYHIVSDVPQITHTTTRLENFALASSEVVTRGAMVFGVEPDGENRITELSKWLIQGEYFHGNNNGILIGTDLAQYLNLSLHDTLVLLGTGYHGAGAAGKFFIQGILKFPNPQLNKQSIYMDLPTCQELFSAPGRVSSMILMVAEENQRSLALRS